MSYTKDQEATLTEASPVTYADAVAFGVAMSKSTKSVISKVQSLGLTYVRKPVAAKKVAPETKAELVTQIEAATGLNLTGLSNATVAALVALRNYTNARQEYPDSM